ncbi:hypothetical protein B0A48_07388 [Cryoendolithus antarcticus]|uniref:C2 domain-containing protein n=1 Tax=Cryoendolithus antarcticus TaxID=1507870 RepID=A0A1V8T8V7_9PEZI|nr:hypothetical protein B0A48_07388 [Cryoendolithus antarcticus]
MSGYDDAGEDKRRYIPAHSPHHQIPTISKYREEKENRLAQANAGQDGDDDGSNVSSTDQAKATARRYLSRGDDDHGDANKDGNNDDVDNTSKADDDANGGAQDSHGDGDAPKDTSEVGQAAHPKAKRKGMRKRGDERAEREVTDPITHLPVKIFDFTQDALDDAGENDAPFGSTTRTATGLSNKNKSDEELRDETNEMRAGQEGFNALFPPPSIDGIKHELADINKLGMTVGLVGVSTLAVLALALERLLRPTATLSIRSVATWSALSLLVAGGGWALIAGIRDWTDKRIETLWEEEMWESNRKRSKDDSEHHDPESTRWLNSLVASVWPLVNPDLFISLADTLEDVMQASLPRLVRMVSVDDIGQGSEALRILGVRWLPTGAAARSVGSDGRLKKAQEGGDHKNDRTVPGEGEVEKSDDNGSRSENDKGNKQDEQEDQAVEEGMEAEEGDFINLEVAFAYRARSEKKMARKRMKDMHLMLAFYLPGNIKLPVWVDLRGVVGTMRMRLQLTPDPPFFALCTLTFMGQPKVDLSCQPLSKHGLNIMDLPVISNFVKSAVDAAMAEYVAPKSLTLDLKDMLVGDDFKKDTAARGILVVRIRRGYDFKVGDAGIPLIKEGSADPYVSVGWAKFGKPLWSTRLLTDEMEPVWEETVYLLITPEQLNVDERLRVQLWDSDRLTADDDLGRIEVDLKTLMRDSASNGKMCPRSDGFRALKAGEDLPGKLDWEIGYFSKVRIQPCQLAKQTYDTEIRTMEQLREKVDRICKRKLREALVKENREKQDEDELEQQKAQEMKMHQDNMMISAPPPEGYPSGVFSIQIHQITGLELEQTSKKADDKNAAKDQEEEEGDTLPSAYCNVMINHRKVFKTRTKPKNAKPFFNAGTERFIPDWQNAEVHVSVRDARVHEDDALLGIVHLSLADVFKHRSQVNGFWPLSGGVGYGRIRLSLVWRSVQLQAPPKALGWELGTLQVKPGITSSSLSQDVTKLRLKLGTNLSTAKFSPAKEGEHAWSGRKGRSAYLAVSKRYSSCFSIRFRHKQMIGNNNAAFAVLWLRDIPDETEKEIELTVWKGDFKRAVACSLDECGEKLGTIKLKVLFWSGLGSAHGKWASGDPDMKQVVQVLDVARDNEEEEKAGKEAGIVDEEMSSSSDDDDDSSNDGDDKNGTDDKAKPDGLEQKGRSMTTDGKGITNGWADSAKEYKKNMKSVHRRHRGVMQWKIPRTAEWAAHKAERAEAKITGLFKHNSREPGIETEV